MKLHFEADLEYQLDAIKAVCDLFGGQKSGQHSPFTVVMPRDSSSLFAGTENDLGFGNRLNIHKGQLSQNLTELQLVRGLKPSLNAGTELDESDFNFTVEMETGTGKTYVYLRTIFELNKQYGFTKFVVVVPSVAIKEGVYKSLEIMADHFRGIYDNVPFSAGNNYFLYDSSKLGQVRNFATSNQIQVMVVTVGAINKKDVNNLYKPSEKVGDETPIQLIRETRPIVIVDEPQTVDGGLEGQGKKALDEMKPLCTLRYSATHVDKHHMVYKLDAVDAYQRKLVKQIEVASLEVIDAHNKAFVKVIAAKTARGKITASLELDVQQATGVKRKSVTVSDGDDLEQTTGRAIYANCLVGEIRTGKGNELVEIKAPGGEHFLKLGDEIGGVSREAFQRTLIRRTIKEHLDKELWLRPRGIKVLSLFFIDAVDKYRQYDADGNAVKGQYALIFEDEYARLAKHPDYKNLFGEIDATTEAADAHEGYFSIDKKGVVQDTAETNAGNRENAERAYSLIMRDKEKLLSFETKLKFIFSHSALREGWDNPNVFQICVLRDMGTELRRRQTIGRGLRLCVNQNGERVRDDGVNVLTVMATESYREFAERLQKEIEDDTGIRFGIVEKHTFANLSVSDGRGGLEPLGFAKSGDLWESLRGLDMIEATGKVKDALRKALLDGTLALPPSCAGIEGAILAVLRKLSGRLEVKDADQRKTVKVRREIVLEDPGFKALWDRIKHKTTYRVNFDNEKLIRDCAKAIENGPGIARTRVQFNKAELDIDKGGVTAQQTKVSGTVFLEERDIELPDILTDLQNKTQLTRRSLAAILERSDRLNDFAKNPHEFIEIVAEAIRKTKRQALVDGIKYQRLGNEHFYAQQLFLDEELRSYLTDALESKKGAFEKVVYDSTVERTFAEQLELNESVKVYAKLPMWFKVPTPLGSYQPDWAVLVEKDGNERLYFVVETKGSTFGIDLRADEQGKIECGKEHFKTIADGENPAKFILAKTLDDVLNGADAGGREQLEFASAPARRAGQ